MDWIVSDRPIPYNTALQFMERRVIGIRSGTEAEAIWLLQHPPLYTAGTSAQPEDLLNPSRFPVFRSGRGGQYTYHGPGQRVVYVMMDLQKQRDIRRFVTKLEQWVLKTLACFNLDGITHENRVGVWIKRPDKAPFSDGRPAEDKIAAIGIRLKKWVSYHGISINVDPDLEHYSGINACGISDYGVTSLVDLGLLVSFYELDIALRQCFPEVFATTPQDSLIDL
ncbi:MAG: lipoyl(octanoyl) transferase LipB [Aestuariivita sp.]|nr:lipoyl(octanoyl) transferase LipB [Aestuariivita sp.]MCY4201770.1 lipoyl(octanoyl) transferase LipB [Aestuariivita sp.]